MRAFFLYTDIYNKNKYNIMNNIFNINEEEKNRIRALHKNYSIIKEEDEVKDTEDTDMIEGIAVADLHPYVYESLKNKKKMTAAQMLKMMAGCYDDDEEMMSLVGYAHDYPSTASGGQKIEPSSGEYKKKGTLYLHYRSGHGSQTWENLCDFPDNIRDGKWISLPGFDWDQELMKSISDYWEAADGLKNLSNADTDGFWDNDTNDWVPGSGELPVEQKQQRYETGKKLMWKWDDDEAWFLTVR